MRLNKILVPTDISEAGNTAFLTAEQIRSLFDGTVTPMYNFRTVVWPDGISLPDFESGLTDDAKKQIKKRLKNMALHSIPEESIGEPVVGYGDPVSQILKRSEGFDLIVMSTHGRKGFSKAVLGSVSGKVIRRSQIPVIVTRGKPPRSGLNKILLTTDFSEASFQAFPYVEAILEKNMDITVDMVHMVSLEHTSSIQDGRKLMQKRKNDLTKLVDQYFPKYKDRIHAEVETSLKSAHEGILTLIDTRDYDLVVMATTGKTGLKYVLLGSCVLKVIESSDTPVLVVGQGE